MNITELPKKFDKKGWVYKQIQNAHCYIYQVTDEHSNIHYEVFAKKTTPVCINFERKEYSDTEHKHRYPNDADFGVWAWNYRSLNSAYSKAGRIESENKTRKVQNEAIKLCKSCIFSSRTSVYVNTLDCSVKGKTIGSHATICDKYEDRFEEINGEQIDVSDMPDFTSKEEIEAERINKED